MKKYNRTFRSIALLTCGAILIAPLGACSKKVDPDKIAKPRAATTATDANGDLLPDDDQKWLSVGHGADDESEASALFRYYDMGVFVGSSDLLTAYYSFDDPKNYYSDWPTVGLHFPTEDEYTAASESYASFAQELATLDQDELTEGQNRAIKDMCYDFLYMSQEYKYYQYVPHLNPMGGKQILYPLLTSLIQFNSKDDVMRYFVILEDYLNFFTQVFEAEKKRSEMGIGWSDECIDRIIEDCVKMQEDRDTNFMKTTFESRVGALHLSDQETKELIRRNDELLATSYYPAFEMLIEKLPELKGMCNDTPYLASTADGKAYYEALFHLTTGTDMSVEECTELLQAKISEVYDTYLPLWQKNGTYFGYGDLSFDDARKWCERFTFEHFPQISANEVSIFNVPEKFSESVQPATYYSAPIDNFTKHTVWVNTGLVENPEYNMFTLISHEMYPGHLYQHQYQAENLESRYQVFATSKAYAEGWAKYSEWTMIHYAPFDPQLAESAWTASLLYSILIAARMSIGIEYEGWTYEDCETYLNHYGVDSSVMDEYWSSLTAEQCFAVEYAFGFIFTSEIIDSAVKELDGICTKEEVMKAYLDLGCAPFPILKEDMEKFVESKKS